MALELHLTTSPWMDATPGVWRRVTVDTVSPKEDRLVRLTLAAGTHGNEIPQHEQGIDLSVEECESVARMLMLAVRTRYGGDRFAHASVMD